MRRYNPQAIEPKWQQIWAESDLYKVDMTRTADKFYVIPMLPYPSGDLHVGHWYNFAPTDTVARFRRMLGQNVLQTIGFDAFGLPAENAAIKRGLQPAKWTHQNIATMTKQIEQIGASYDWSHSLATCDPSYYRWNQWLFLQLYKHKLAYRAKAVVNWCPKDQTVLANEQVVGENNVCERCGTPVVQKEMEQWFFKITDYTERLLNDLESVDWPERVKTMQVNWIGKSQGALIDFAIDGQKHSLSVFTTRPDTIYGATYMVLAPEHPLVEKITTADNKAHIKAYIEETSHKTELERKSEDKVKSGSFTGAYAINPANNQKIPIWIADYVLMGYGTGAIMAVPAHDERDWDFATKFHLPIQTVVLPDFGDPLDDEQYVEGTVVIPYDPATKKYLGLTKWVNGIGLVGGGLDKGESFEDCAKRELAEEAGIKDIDKLIKLGEPVYSHYYNNLKKINRRSLGQGYLAVVKDSSLGQTKLETHEKFVPAWLGMDEIRSGINKLRNSKGAGGVDHWLAMCDRAEAAVKALEAGTTYNGSPYQGEGLLINSDRYDGVSTAIAREVIVADLSGGQAEPLFSQTTEPGAIRAGLPFVERQAITAIVKHWSEDKYLGLRWKEVDWETFITGGIESGQTAEEAAMAEIREETGYQNPKLIKTLGKTHAKFFHVPKNENRFAHFTCLYFELQDDEHKPLADTEQKKHEVVWLSPEQVATFRLPESHRYNWNQLLGSANSKAVAKAQTNYRLRDWLISRQRYWGTPIPIIYCDTCGTVPVPEADLPVLLPEDVEFELSGRSPLQDRPDFVNTTCPKCGKPAKRETDTMDTFVCSSWYFLRYLDNHNHKAPFNPEIINKWAPLDHYIGGIEHAILHLLYARFITKFLHDNYGLSFSEPFKKLTNQGIILGSDGQKMSKSRGNVVSPDEQVKSYGADSLRLYLMFMGPYDQGGPYSMGGIAGTRRFLERVWLLVEEFAAAPEAGEARLKELELVAATHRVIKKVTKDLEKLDFNTSIAAMMAFTNELYKLKADKDVPKSPGWRLALQSLTQLLAPFAPHISEEMWQSLGHESSVHVSNWPIWDEALVKEETITLAVQVNGKLRAEIIVPAAIDEAAAIKTALADEKVASYLKAKSLKKTIYVPGRLISLVVV